MKQKEYQTFSHSGVNIEFEKNPLYIGDFFKNNMLQTTLKKILTKYGRKKLSSPFEIFLKSKLWTAEYFA